MDDFYPGIGVSKKWKESSCVLLVSVLAVFWYQNHYWYRTFPSNSMNVRTSIGIGIRVSVKHLLRSNHCKTFDMIKKTLKTSTGWHATTLKALSLIMVIFKLELLCQMFRPKLKVGKLKSTHSRSLVVILIHV